MGFFIAEPLILFRLCLGACDDFVPQEKVAAAVSVTTPPSPVLAVVPAVHDSAHPLAVRPRCRVLRSHLPTGP